MAMVASGVLAMLSGCSPVPTGIVAVSINSEGVPVAVFLDCEEGGGMEHLTVTVAGENGVGYKGRYRWVSPDGDVTPGLVVLDQKSEWATDSSLAAFEPGVEYRMGAGSSSNARSSTKVDFTLEDLQSIGAGEVMVDRYDPAVKEFQPVIESAQEFLASACSKRK